jgi:hypothetical protein
VLGSLGLLIFAAGSLGLAYLTLTWFVRMFDPEVFLPLSDRPLLIYSVAALLLGAHMLAIGILAEMQTAARRDDDDAYTIAEDLQGAA